MNAGYSFSLGPVLYVAWKDGRPFGLADVWREVRGVGGAVIYRPDGSELLRNAGESVPRELLVRRARAHNGACRARRARALAVRRARAARAAAYRCRCDEGGGICHACAGAWPRWAGGELVWACCVSDVGPACRHRVG